jgi:hypothetical protein
VDPPFLFNDYVNHDLQLIHKVRSGQAIEDAVEDIISRSIGELRKNAFGEDIEDAKSLSWTREQAWAVLKQLAQKAEVSLLCYAVLCKRSPTLWTRSFHITMYWQTSRSRETSSPCDLWSMRN